MWVGLVIALAAAGCSFRGGHAAGDDAQPIDGTASDGIGSGSGDASTRRLVDRGLVARYLIAEATTGQTPTQLEDVAANPLPLAITYSTNLAFTAPNGHRGLAWSTLAGDSARADVPIVGTKLAQQLSSATQFTLEVVVDVQAVTPPSGINCRIITIATSANGYGQASLLTFDLQNISLFLDGQSTVWSVAQNTGRHVMTGVVDTTQQTAGDRTQLYVDGVLATRSGGTDPLQDVALQLATTDYFTLGNIDTGGRSFIGDEFYGAIYNAALTPAEVLQNATALLADDDHE